MDGSVSRKESSKNIQRALKAILEDEKSVTDAARCYGVAKATLKERLKLQDPYQVGKNGSPSESVLTEDEETMVARLISKRSEMGYPLTDDFIKFTIRDALDHCGKTNTFEKSNIPNENWIESFLRRHAELSNVKSAAVLNKSGLSSQKDITLNWYKNLQTYIQSQGLNPRKFLSKQNGQRIFTACETRVMIESGTIHQAGSTWEEEMTSGIDNKNKPVITAMTTTNHGGSFFKSFFVFPGTRPLKDFSDVDESAFDVARSKNGEMSHETFVDWLLAFIEQIDSWKIPKPVMLFLDGHSHYISTTSCEIAREASVIIALLPPVLKPLNPVLESLMIAFKENCQQNVTKLGTNNLKNNFPSVFMNAFKVCPNKKKCVALGFQQTGLVPLDLAKVEEYPNGPFSPLPNESCNKSAQNTATPTGSPIKSPLASPNKLSIISSTNGEAPTKNITAKVPTQKNPSTKSKQSTTELTSIPSASKKSKAQLVGEIRDFAYLHGFKDAISLIVEQFVGESVLSIYEEALHSDTDDIKDNIFLIWKCLNERLKEKTNTLYNKRKEEREKLNNLTPDEVAIKVEKNCVVERFGSTSPDIKKSSSKRKSNSDSLPRTSKKVKSEDTNFCQKCKKRSGKAIEWIGCDCCESWFHKTCIGISTELPNEEVRNMEWRCQQCE